MHTRRYYALGIGLLLLVIIGLSACTLPIGGNIVKDVSPEPTPEIPAGTLPAGSVVIVGETGTGNDTSENNSTAPEQHQEAESVESWYRSHRSSGSGGSRSSGGSSGSDNDDNNDDSSISGDSPSDDNGNNEIPDPEEETTMNNTLLSALRASGRSESEVPAPAAPGME